MYINLFFVQNIAVPNYQNFKQKSTRKIIGTFAACVLIYTGVSIIFGHVVLSKIRVYGWDWIFTINFENKIVNSIYFILIIILAMCFLIYSGFFNFLFFETNFSQISTKTRIFAASTNLLVVVLIASLLPSLVEFLRINATINQYLSGVLLPMILSIPLMNKYLRFLPITYALFIGFFFAKSFF